jgi:transposase-like protein
MNHTLDRGESEADEEGGQALKLSSLAFSNAMEASIPKSAPIALSIYTLQKVIRGRVEPNSVIHSDGWRKYDGLVDVGYEKHFRVYHGANEFATGDRHINGIESFWSFAKKRLARFNGIRKEDLYLYLKETEFGFNHRQQDVYKTILKILLKKPLF